MDIRMPSRPFLLKSGLVVFLLLLMFQYWRLLAVWFPDRLLARHQSAGNSTLGFGAVFAVTPNDPPARMSWRKSGMQRAADYTGLDIQYPVQPAWDDSDVERLTSNSDGQLLRNASLAWLGHLHTLEHASRHTTALILEDDADWDVGIRAQSVRVAKAIWHLTQSSPPPLPSGARATPEDGYPYGLEWDVLWLGHCGSSMPAADDTRITSFADASIGPDTPDPMPLLPSDVPRRDGASMRCSYVYRTGSPICTFAYAVRQEVARDILERAAGQSVALDVWLHFQCERDELRCYAVNPELFHQHEMPGVHDSMIGGLDPDNIVEHRRSKNIWHSARCNADLAAGRDSVIACPL